MGLHGRGSQKWMTKSFEEERNDVLENREKYDERKQKAYGVEFPEGGGRSDPELYILESIPLHPDGRERDIDLEKEYAEDGY